MLSNASVQPALPAKDFDRAKQFYSETLGLKVQKDMGDLGIDYAVGSGSVLGLYPSAFAGTNQATAAEFVVNNLEAEMKELRNKGVSFEEYDLPEIKTQNGVATMGNAKIAWFKDTEGNILSIVQYS